MKAFRAILASELARASMTFVRETVKGFKKRREARK